ncbi:hypothetical protein, partial [Tritonibacter sp. SIMBA_163]|uniref:hypothetical protein n=1 Tax=Tritonibacter sp. SIMBA_163 TaxID=3080868 RepID=UPI00397F4C62
WLGAIRLGEEGEHRGRDRAAEERAWAEALDTLRAARDRVRDHVDEYDALLLMPEPAAPVRRRARLYLDDALDPATVDASRDLGERLAA